MGVRNSPTQLPELSRQIAHSERLRDLATRKKSAGNGEAVLPHHKQEPSRKVGMRERIEKLVVDTHRRVLRGSPRELSRFRSATPISSSALQKSTRSRAARDAPALLRDRCPRCRRRCSAPCCKLARITTRDHCAQLSPTSPYRSCAQRISAECLGQPTRNELHGPVFEAVDVAIERSNKSVHMFLIVVEHQRPIPVVRRRRARLGVEGTLDHGRDALRESESPLVQEYPEAH